MFIEINPDNIDSRKIREVGNVLNAGGIVIFPTDTVYSMGCSLSSPKAIKNLVKLKGLKSNKINFSLLCSSLSTLSDYTKQVDRPTFKAMNRSLPGPFTFILNASNKIPKLFGQSKKTVGIRIPDNQITLDLIEYTGHPLVGTSVHDDDEIIEYTTDPYAIYQNWEGKVDAIIDGGYGRNEGSTVIDYTGGEPEVLREGLGDINLVL